METYEILKDLAIIFICAKGVGLLARRLKAPMVVGEIVAGMLIGPCLLNMVQPYSGKSAEVLPVSVPAEPKQPEIEESAIDWDFIGG